MQRYLNLSKRKINGILLLDKPCGVSSSFISYRIKKMFCADKVGHAGTLDPIGTGMLPICFGKATKLANYLLLSDKRYKVLAKLGESTNTFDSDGTVIRTSPINFNSIKLEQCVNIFKGKFNQIPPMFSSLKHHGVPLYKYARKGVDIPRKSRVVYIYDLFFYQKDLDIIELDVRCSKGTYMRSLVNDFGECLGCGAHVIRLRRLMVGKYLPCAMINIKTIESIFYDKTLNDLIVLNKLDALLISMREF